MRGRDIFPGELISCSFPRLSRDYQFHAAVNLRGFRIHFRQGVKPAGTGEVSPTSVLVDPEKSHRPADSVAKETGLQIGTVEETDFDLVPRSRNIQPPFTRERQRFSRPFEVQLEVGDIEGEVPGEGEAIGAVECERVGR
jgi:hypothetical protein